MSDHIDTLNATAATARHDGAVQTAAVLTELAVADGWLSIGDIAGRCDLNRDTVRRVLTTLEAIQWTERRPTDGRDLWRIGAELPRIGIQYQASLFRRQQALYANWERTQLPFHKTTPPKVTP